MANVFSNLFKTPAERACDYFEASYAKYNDAGLNANEREKARLEALRAIEAVRGYKKKGGADWLAKEPQLKRKVEDVLAKELKLIKPAPVAKEEQKPLEKDSAWMKEFELD